MDAERLIRLAVTGDFSVVRDFKIEAKRRSDPYLNIILDLFNFNKKMKEDSLGSEFFSEYSGYPTLIKKHQDTIRNLSDEQIEHIDKISSFIVPYYKRKGKMEVDQTPENFSFLKLCRHIDISNEDMLYYIGKSSKLAGDYGLTISSNSPVLKRYTRHLLSKLGTIKYLNLASFRSAEVLNYPDYFRDLECLITSLYYGDVSYYLEGDLKKSGLQQLLENLTELKHLVASIRWFRSIPPNLKIKCLETRINPNSVGGSSGVTGKPLPLLNPEIFVEKLLITITDVNDTQLRTAIGSLNKLRERLPNVKELYLRVVSPRLKPMNYTKLEDWTTYSVDLFVRELY